MGTGGVGSHAVDAAATTTGDTATTAGLGGTDPTPASAVPAVPLVVAAACSWPATRATAPKHAATCAAVSTRIGSMLPVPAAALALVDGRLPPFPMVPVRMLSPLAAAEGGSGTNGTGEEEPGSTATAAVAAGGTVGRSAADASPAASSAAASSSVAPSAFPAVMSKSCVKRASVPHSESSASHSRRAAAGSQASTTGISAMMDSTAPSAAVWPAEIAATRLPPPPAAAAACGAASFPASFSDFCAARTGGKHRSTSALGAAMSTSGPPSTASGPRLNPGAGGGAAIRRPSCGTRLS